MSKSPNEQNMSRVYPPMRKVLVIEWPDQRTVFEKHKGKIIGGTAAGIAGAIALPIALPLLGFTSAGVAAGSIAASVQSVVYGGATGGLFAAAQSAGAAGVAAATTAGMAASGAAAGLAVGSFADNSNPRQKEFVKQMKNKDEKKIHIYSDKIYIGLRKLPGTCDMRKYFLQSLSCASEREKSVIILGGRQFTIYDDYYIEENINITDGYLWFVQYDNHKEISLKEFRLFMTKLNSSNLDFNDAVDYIGVSFSEIPQFSYIIDGSDKCHINQWTTRPKNKMLPILVPNIGFKEFAEIKPNLKTWLTDIRANPKSMQAIHKTISSDVKKDFFEETYTVLDHQPSEGISPSGVLSITPNEDTRVKQTHSTSQTMNLLNMNIKVLIYQS